MSKILSSIQNFGSADPVVFRKWPGPWPFTGVQIGNGLGDGNGEYVKSIEVAKGHFPHISMGIPYGFIIPDLIPHKSIY